MPPEARSPYELVLGDRVSELHPRLQAYFRGIPAGWRGCGAGTFDTVGTPRRWFWPVLWVLARQGVLFPVWERDVPFTVVNRPARDRQGNVAVTATRTFSTRAGARRMVDAITAENGKLVDYLGFRRRYRAHFAVSVDGGALTMSTTALAVRIRRHWLTVPRAIAPAVTLTEQFDEQSGRQRVAVITTMPVIGRVYEYAGSFDYELRQGDGPTPVNGPGNSASRGE